MSKIQIRDLLRDPSCTTVQWYEDSIQAHIVQKLEKSGYLFRVGLEGMRVSPSTANKMKMLGMRPGEPDLLIYRPNEKIVLIELKRKDGTLGANQKKRHKKLSELGFAIHTVWAQTPADGWDKVERILSNQ